MTHAMQRRYLIEELLKEEKAYQEIAVPSDEESQKKLLRALMNVRPPRACSSEFLEVQDAYLTAETAAKGITDLSELTPVRENLYLWQGDITTLRCDAIVNAANSGMTGCYVPNHRCIDNCIHSFAGIELRLACASLMKRQGHEEPTGQAKITPAFNLPCKYVIHTVGPIVSGWLTSRDCSLLASCYRSCLHLAVEQGLKSIAFCCISTGEFHFPNEKAAQIAVETVENYFEETGKRIDVIFNVFKEEDLKIYQNLL